MLSQLMRVVLLCVMLGLSSGCARTSESFQQDADIIRLRHLKYYSEILEEYYSVAGKYPFQGRESVPLYVHVANDRQMEFAKHGPPYEHVMVPFGEFVQEVESKLNREIGEFYDPQYVPVYKPTFYIYMINADTYFFAVHVYQPYPFAKEVGNHYYKVELSNHPTPQNGAVSPGPLLASEEYQEAVGKAVSKQGFFEKREEKYRRFTKDAAQ